MNLKQVDELVVDLLERFKKLRSRCNVYFLEFEYANIVIGNMHLQLREKLIAHECSNLT